MSDNRFQVGQRVRVTGSVQSLKDYDGGAIADIQVTNSASGWNTVRIKIDSLEPLPDEAPDLICSHCGRANKSDRRVCERCEHPLPSHIICRNCGYMAQYPICTKCGTPVPAPTQEEAGATPSDAEIAALARAFIHEPENWQAYQDSKGSNSVAWPPEFLLLAQAIETRFGPMPVEDDV
jgi:hypothetical protein